MFGVNPVATYNSNGSVSSWSTGVSGDGALLRISNGSLVDIERNFVPGVYQVPTTTPAPAGPGLDSRPRQTSRSGTMSRSWAKH